MKARKPTNDDVSYVDRKLIVLRDQIDKAERYLSEILGINRRFR